MVDDDQLKKDCISLVQKDLSLPDAGGRITRSLFQSLWSIAATSGGHRDNLTVPRVDMQVPRVDMRRPTQVEEAGPSEPAQK
jgi:hypothetical protein